jgi:hypothetical protein
MAVTGALFGLVLLAGACSGGNADRRRRRTVKRSKEVRSRQNDRPSLLSVLLRVATHKQERP